MHSMYSDAEIVLTLGKDGAIGVDKDSNEYKQPIFPVQAVDTTAAGDTFTGYFLAMQIGGKGWQESMRIAALASAITVSRPGAAPSIPSLQEVESRFREL